MRTATATAAITLAALGGFVLAQLRTATTTVEPVATERVVVKDLDGLDAQTLRAMIRTTIRDELRTLAPTTVVSSAGAAAEIEPASAPEPTPVRLAARHDADSLVASAISNGRWREEDRDRLTTTSRDLSDAERADIVRPLVIAINQQRVTFDFIGPLL